MSTGFLITLHLVKLCVCVCAFVCVYVFYLLLGGVFRDTDLLLRVPLKLVCGPGRPLGFCDCDLLSLAPVGRTLSPPARRDRLTARSSFLYNAPRSLAMVFDGISLLSSRLAGWPLSLMAPFCLPSGSRCLARLEVCAAGPPLAVPPTRLCGLPSCRWFLSLPPSPFSFCCRP